MGPELPHIMGLEQSVLERVRTHAWVRWTGVSCSPGLSLPPLPKAYLRLHSSFPLLLVFRGVSTMQNSKEGTARKEVGFDLPALGLV